MDLSARVFALHRSMGGKKSQCFKFQRACIPALLGQKEKYLNPHFIDGLGEIVLSGNFLNISPR
jgi:hypothetical protein